MIDGFHSGITKADLEHALAPLRKLDKGIQRRALARVARAGGKEQLAVLKQVIPRRRGITRRASAQKVKRYGGTAVSISGQKKGKVYKKTKYKPHSGLSGQGIPVPLHMLESKIRAHRIPGRINRLGIQTRGKVSKGIRNRKPMTLPGGFAWRVRHPGMPARDLMGKVHLQSFKRALRMAIAVATVEAKIEAEKARNLSTWD